MAAAYTADTFTKETSSGVTIVDFWATWCGPCTMLAPVIDELEKEFEGKIKVGKVNVDEEQELSAQYEVMSIPTVLVMKDGQEFKRIIGVRGKQNFVDAINEALK